MRYNVLACPRSSMDRVPDFESVGCGFDSRRGHVYARSFSRISINSIKGFPVTQPTPLEVDFHKHMIDIYRRAKEECGYNPTRFLQMVSNEGGLQTARKLLATTEPSDGFVELWSKHRLDLTMENLVLQRKFRQLFSDQEIQIARERLVSYGFSVMES